MEKSKVNIKAVIIAVTVVAAVTAVLLLLIPVENKHKFYEKWGKLAVMAETDERAKFITENEELYPENILKLCYKEEDDFDFAYNYPFHKDDYASMSFTEEELNCGEIPALYMSDKRWAYESIGGGYIKYTGCMAVSLTMANLYLNHNDAVDPPKVAAVTENLDNVGFFGGVSNEKLQEVINELGFTSEVHDYTEDRKKIKTVDIETIRGIIDSGHVCLACTVGETFGQHALIIREVTEDGKLLINDPADAENTAKVWNFEELEPEIYFLWDLS